MALDVQIRPPSEPGPAGGAMALLVHGSMDRGLSFTRMQTFLRDWTTVTYDRRGYARSFDAVPAPGSFDALPAPGSFDAVPASGFGEHVDDFVDVVARCRESRPGDTTIVAFGHSAGGAVVLAAASRVPALLSAAVIWEPPQPWAEWWSRGPWFTAPTPEDAGETFMRQAVGDRVWARLPAATRSQRRREGRALMAELDGLTTGCPWGSAPLDLPLIVGYGSESRLQHQRSSRELAAAMPGARLVCIDGASHGVHLGHPGQAAGLLRQALEWARADRRKRWIRPRRPDRRRRTP